jgi:hypothetical protein
MSPHNADQFRDIAAFEKEVVAFAKAGGPVSRPNLGSHGSCRPAFFLRDRSTR